MKIQPCGGRYIDAGAMEGAPARALARQVQQAQQGHTTAAHPWEKVSLPTAKATATDMSRVQPMSLWQEACCMLLLGFGVPNGVFSIPMATFAVGYFVIGNVAWAFQVLVALLMPLALLPQPFLPDILTSWMANKILKYFSFRLVCADGASFFMQEDVGRVTKATAAMRPQIFVAPPHGILYVRIRRYLAQSQTIDWLSRTHTPLSLFLSFTMIALTYVSPCTSLYVLVSLNLKHSRYHTPLSLFLYFSPPQ
jgi:hypothetical protein